MKYDKMVAPVDSADVTGENREAVSVSKKIATIRGAFKRDVLRWE